MLGRRVWRARAGSAQTLDDRGDYRPICIGADDLHLDLTESRRHPAAVTHRHLVVDDLGDAVALRVHQADAHAGG